jgi:hypothetical protein
MRALDSSLALILPYLINIVIPPGVDMASSYVRGITRLRSYMTGFVAHDAYSDISAVSRTRLLAVRASSRCTHAGLSDQC